MQGLQNQAKMFDVQVQQRPLWLLQVGRKERRMKEWICRELSTSTSDNENGVLMIEKELIRCKDCKYFTRDSITGVTIPGTEYCIFTMNNRIEENDYCSRAERKE